MTVLYLEALTAMAVLLSVRMVGAWIVQPRAGNAGRVDAIWTVSLGLARVTGTPSLEPQLLRPRDDRYRDCVSPVPVSSSRCRRKMIPESGGRSSKRSAQKGSGHMSFVSTIMAGTAERVPLPDVIIRAAIHRLCSRTANKARHRQHRKRRMVRRRVGRARHRRVQRRGHRAASRGAVGVLRACVGATRNIPRASTGSRPRRCRRPKRRRCVRRSGTPISLTANRFSNSAAAGVRCRCGWRGNSRIRK